MSGLVELEAHRERHLGIITRLRKRGRLWSLLAPVRWAARGLLSCDPLCVADATLRGALATAAPYAHGTMLDIGCGVKPYAGMFPVARHLGVDMRGRHADAHADALQVPFSDASMDTVLCSQVLEHVCEPAVLMSEAYRLLRPGGHLILTTPQTWGLHLVPYDYYRYTRFGLEHLAAQAGFSVVRVEPTCGFWATAGQRLADVIFNTYAATLPWYLTMPMRPACMGIAKLGLALDQMVGKSGDTLDNLLIAQKRG